MNYYNEIDPFAAEWLRHLIIEQHIGFGVVDERSIVDVRPSDLVGFTQCHFFAGIGVWSYALRKAGWGDHRPVWTGSCPCQPFSAAGKGKGKDDERHLWPVFHELIRQCRPDVIFGEQVEAAINHGWLDLVQSDLEGEGYAVGAVGFPAASVGAPHIRQRLYWLADADSGECGRVAEFRGTERDGEDLRRAESSGSVTTCRESGELGNNNNKGSQGRPLLPERDGECTVGSAGVASRVDNTIGIGWREIGNNDPKHDGQQLDTVGVHNFWSECEWLPCRDGKWRPVEPGTFPLAHGSPARVGRLRGYGNAIVAPQAQAFIKAYMTL
jgi:DNA (cytosine-5)-methyltransferase 1